MAAVWLTRTPLGALYRVAVECPNIGFTPEGDPWREINIDPGLCDCCSWLRFTGCSAEQSEVNIIGDPNNEHSGGVEIKAAFDIHVRPIIQTFVLFSVDFLGG